MPALQQLRIQNLRNLEQLELEFSVGFNVFHGENGSGKTSILEAIYLLGLARSFRSGKLKPLISYDQPEVTVFGQLFEGGSSLGVSKTARGKQDVRVGGKVAGSAAELAYQLPLQLFNSDTFMILEGGPKKRRTFLDWGVFHVEPLFLGYWRHTLKSLQQRNSLLKKQASEQEILPWTQEFSRYGELIDTFRQDYLKEFIPILNDILQELFPLEGLTLSYNRGWDEPDSLAQALANNLRKDYQYGHSTCGPHRADLKIKLGGIDAAEVLSRGQQKLLVCALKLAQGSMLSSVKRRQCIYLIDDLPSELDRANRTKVMAVLASLESQVFISCVESKDLESSLINVEEKRLFHVKHGKILE